MKSTSKFLAVMLAITGLFCCAVAVGIGAGFNAVRESTDKKIIAVAEKVKEQYPDISEKELAQILNNDTAGIKGDFAKYGIKSDSGWVDIQSGSYATITIVIATAGVCVFGILLCVVFIRYCKKQKRQRLEIVKCLEKINNREYNLDLDGSTDDDMSLLKQEIQKTTVMLREYADNSMREKEILKNSLADISHQLKTPLTSMMVMTVLIKDEKGEDKRGEFINIIENQLDKMKWLITNLLKISKLDAGTTEFKHEKVSMKSVLNRSLKPFYVTCDIKQIEIINSAEDFDFIGDSSWTGEAIENIIKNCIEHTDKKGHLKFYCEKTNVFNSLFIEDDGCGIAPNDLPHIFERFYHGENSSNESVGIGLALAKTVLEKEKGDIIVNSELGKGSIFELRFYKTIV